jgi:hypothetical protein
MEKKHVDIADLSSSDVEHLTPAHRGARLDSCSPIGEVFSRHSGLGEVG